MILSRRQATSCRLRLSALRAVMISLAASRSASCSPIPLAFREPLASYAARARLVLSKDANLLLSLAILPRRGQQHPRSWADWPVDFELIRPPCPHLNNRGGLFDHPQMTGLSEGGERLDPFCALPRGLVPRRRQQRLTMWSNNARGPPTLAIVPKSGFPKMDPPRTPPPNLPCR